MTLLGHVKSRAAGWDAEFIREIPNRAPASLPFAQHSEDALGSVQLICAAPTWRFDKADYAMLAPSPASQTADEPTRPIAPGGTLTGVIDTSGDVDYFTINLVAGVTYSISLAGSGAAPLVDSFLSLSSAGVTVASDDDGGSGTNSLLTFTASTTGTYQITAAAYTGSGLTGGYTLDVRQMGADSVGSAIASATPAAVGTTTHGFIETSNDIDMYAVTLVAGQYYSFELAGGADYNTPASVPPGELDTQLTVYDAAGNQIAFNDNLSADDISSGLGFSPSVSGTYYVRVNAARGQTGGYTLDVQQIDLSNLNPLDTIDWGTQLPSGAVTVYFAAAGETFDGQTSLGWSQYEIDQAMVALQTWADVANLTFSITNNASAATFKLVTTTSTEFLGYFNPPGTTNAGVGVFATNGSGWDTTGGLETGGYGFITLVHEFGNGLGLAHPHDNGGTSSVMPGVTSPFDSFGVFDLNQGVYTTMSYNDGWQLHPTASGSGSANYGYQSGPSALDIALVQIKYGATSFNTGDNVYVLPTANAAGTFWDVIWDTGGTDTIQHDGTVSARIDLTAATLDYSATGGGVISFVNGIYGGFTIAGGVVIENATGGSGNDVLIGNSANNVLDGRAGNDTLQGNAGTDTFKFNAGGGQDTITDLTTGEIVEIRGYTAVQSITQNGADVVVVLSATDQITFLNTTVATVQGTLRFADVPQGPTEGNDVLDGTAGDDTINALGGNDVIDGGAGDDVLDGGDGVDTVTYQSAAAGVRVNLALGAAQATGGSGSDTLVNFENLTGSAFVDTLNGDNLANALTGLAGNDTLNGRGGLDTMTGGLGNDLYFVDNAGDVVVEAAGEGIDRVLASTSFTLSADVENLTLIGAAASAGTGNDLANVIVGNGAANILTGAGGNDTLNGGLGADTLVGGTGNDSYVVDNLGDVVTELAGEGSDLVRSTISYTLGDNVERLNIIGNGATSGTGNALANGLTGNNAANTLRGEAGADVIIGGGGGDNIYGGTGNDRLTGGVGLDNFYFDTALNAGPNVDTILDFSSINDSIYLDRTIFSGIAVNGTLAASAFRLGTAALDADDRIVYDQATGKLYYDADGNGAGAAVLFAQLTAGANLTNADLIAY